MNSPAMDEIKAFFRANDQLARHLGIELEDVSPGAAVASLELGPQHLNGVGTTHGGTIFALADFAFAVAANSHGTVAVAINVSISFVKAVRQGTLRASARETALGPKIGTYEVIVLDDEDETVALFNGMVYCKRDPLIPEP